jgi:spermidine synthase
MGCPKVKLNSGEFAEICIDPDFLDIHVLTMGGHVHSAVDVGNPKNMLHLHAEKVTQKIENSFSNRKSINALHLGGGALSIPRYIEAMEIKSSQVVVELYKDLIEFVLVNLPLPPQAKVDFIYGDAFDVVFSDNPKLSFKFDYIFVDAYLEPCTPEHLTTELFYSKVFERLDTKGLLSINVIDNNKFSLVSHHIRVLSEIFSAPVTIDVCSPQVSSDLQNIIISITKE